MRHMPALLRRRPVLRSAACLLLIMLLVPAAGCGAPGDRDTSPPDGPGDDGKAGTGSDGDSAASPPTVDGLTLSGPTVTLEGADDRYAVEGRVDLTLDVGVHGADRVVVTAVDKAEPETPLFCGEARPDPGEDRAVLVWSLPGHSFAATIQVRAENDAGFVTEDTATLIHRPAKGDRDDYRPVYTFDHQAVPFGDWRELPDLPRYFRVHGWLDESRIWGETGGNPVIYEVATSNWHSLNVRTWGLWLEPGGQRFLYTDEQGVWTVGIDGTEPQLVLPVRPDQDPLSSVMYLPGYPDRLFCSPDGTQIVVTIPTEGGAVSFSYGLQDGMRRQLDLGGTPVAWIDGNRLLVEQRVYETADGRRVPGIESSARTDLAVATLADSGDGRTIAGVETITSGRDGQYHEFLGWLDEAHGRFLFRQLERELRPGEGDTVLVGDITRTIIGTRRPVGGEDPLDSWEVPAGVYPTGGFQDGTVWVRRSAGHLELEAGGQINRLLDLGVIRDGGFRPLYRLEYLESVWGPSFGPSGTGVITLWAGGPGDNQPGYHTYLLTPPAD